MSMPVFLSNFPLSGVYSLPVQAGPTVINDVMVRLDYQTKTLTSELLPLLTSLVRRCFYF